MKSCENLCQAGNSPLPWLTMAAMASPSVHPLPPSRPLESAPGDGVHHKPQTWHWKSNRFYTVDHLWNMVFFHCHVWIPEGKEFHQLFNTHMVPKLKRSHTELGVLGEYWLQGMGFVSNMIICSTNEIAVSHPSLSDPICLHKSGMAYLMEFPFETNAWPIPQMSKICGLLGLEFDTWKCLRNMVVTHNYLYIYTQTLVVDIANTTSFIGRVNTMSASLHVDR